MLGDQARGRRTSLRVAGVLLLLGAGACGSSDRTAAPPPVDAATAACRGHWHDLGQDLADRAAAREPSALPHRWTTVLATVDYYRTSAAKGDCGRDLTQQRAAVSALVAFGARLAPLDMQAQLARVHDDAAAYAAGPWPAAPRSAARKGRGAPRPPRPALVARALRDLARQAPLATRQQAAGWGQADTTELGDRAAVAKAVKDLRFLSTQSPAWRRCAADLALIRTALAARRP